MTNRRVIVALLVAGIVLLVGAAIAHFSYPRSHPAPLPEIMPPSSLAELAEQYPDLASILNDAELDSIYKQFLVAYEEGGFEAALELARQRGLLTPGGDVRVSLLLDTNDHTALVAQLKATGAIVISAYHDRLDVAVPISL